MQNDESARLRTLEHYRILDTAAERVFDDLTRLVSSVCETPIGLVSLVDDKRQWFKSKVGIDDTETPREMAFCAHALNRDDLLIVEDAHLDERFKDNPLVTGAPGIRFYAGAPLNMANGHCLGTLCVIDTQPRSLSEKQRSTLCTLRDAVVAHLELRRSLDAMRALEALLPMCAWCHSVKLEPDNTWLPLHDYVGALTDISHAICPACQHAAKNGGEAK